MKDAYVTYNLMKVFYFSGKNSLVGAMNIMRRDMPKELKKYKDVTNKELYKLWSNILSDKNKWRAVTKVAVDHGYELSLEEFSKYYKKELSYKFQKKRKNIHIIAKITDDPALILLAIETRCPVNYIMSPLWDISNV